MALKVSKGWSYNYYSGGSRNFKRGVPDRGARVARGKFLHVATPKHAIVHMSSDVSLNVKLAIAERRPLYILVAGLYTYLPLFRITHWRRILAVARRVRTGAIPERGVDARIWRRRVRKLTSKPRVCLKGGFHGTLRTPSRSATGIGWQCWFYPYKYVCYTVWSGFVFCTQNNTLELTQFGWTV